MEEISVPQSTETILIRLATAILLGAIIGFNRELLQKPAGLRTHTLVALGTALVSAISLQLTRLPGMEDASAVSRVIQGLLAGVGFIGAGVIMQRNRQNEVVGLTTAASIWVVSAVGIAVGLGLWRTGLIATALSMMVLVVGTGLDRLIARFSPRPPVDDA